MYVFDTMYKKHVQASLDWFWFTCNWLRNRGKSFELFTEYSKTKLRQVWSTFNTELKSTLLGHPTYYCIFAPLDLLMLVNGNCCNVFLTSGLKRYKQVTNQRCSHHRNKSKTFRPQTHYYRLKETGYQRSFRLIFKPHSQMIHYNFTSYYIPYWQTLIVKLSINSLLEWKNWEVGRMQSMQFLLEI